MRLLGLVMMVGLAACTSARAPSDAGREAASDASSCFPAPRGFDPGFKNGAVTVSTMPLDVRTMILDDKNRMLVGGAQGPDAFVARIGTDGKVDTTFGTKGMTVQSFSATADVARSIALDAQHRILVGGGLDQGGSSYAFVARFSADGVLDMTFAAGGVWISSISLGATRAIAVDPGGGLYAVGSHHFVQRILDDGTTDPAFPLVQAMTGENIADLAAAGGVIVLDDAGAISKYSVTGMVDAAFGGPVFGAMGTGSALAANGAGFFVADGAKPARLALLDAQGKPTTTATVAMSITSIGVACNRIVLGGGSNNDATVGLLGLDGKPATGDIVVDAYPVATPADASATSLFTAVQPNGAVLFAEGVIGTGSLEIARVHP